MFVEQVTLDTDEELQKKQIRIIHVSPDQADIVYYTKIAGAAIALVIGGLGLIAALFFASTFTLNAEVTRTFLTGAADANGRAQPVTTVISTLDVAVLASFASLMAFIAFLIALFVQDAEITQMDGGANPYVFLFMIIWQVPAFVVVQLVSGVSDVIVLTLISLGVVAWLGLLWMSDLLNSYEYRRSVLRSFNAFGANAFSWIPFLLVVAVAFVIYVILVIYMGFTFSAAARPPFLHLVVPVGFLFLYIFVFVIQGLYLTSTAITATFWRDFALYVLNILLFIYLTAATLAVFAFDGITP